MKLYLFGPMTGYEAFNMPAFDEAAALLRREHFVYSPHDVDRDDGFDWRGSDGDIEVSREAGFDLESAMRRHIRWISAHADGIVGLPGWQASSGSRREVLVAKTCGIPIYVLVDGEMHEINAQVTPIGWPVAA